MSNISDIIYRIKSGERFAIYGAQVVAFGAFTALRSLYGIVPDCFLVSNNEGNPAEIEGVPVKVFDDTKLPQDMFILIAVTELLQDEIRKVLESNGYSNIICLGAHEEHLLMSGYFDSIGKFPLLTGIPMTENRKAEEPDLAVYEAKNHRDKPLGNPPKLKPWERSIQAGAGITDARIAKLLDNTRDNISAKNRMYSEMTATYWVWKNTSHEFKGICHYRRHLILSDEQIVALTGGDIDAALPLPYICCPDTLSQFERFVSDAVIETMLNSLQYLHKDEYDDYLNILKGKYQYTYNLLIAKRDVFDSYCAWVFEILQHMEKSADKIAEIESTRALSYTAEVLTSLYFLSNSDTLCIRHIGKAIFV